MHFFNRILIFFSISPKDRVTNLCLREISESAASIKKFTENNQQIMVEGFQTRSNLLGLVFFLPIIAKELKAELVSFYYMRSNKFLRVKERIRFHNSHYKKFLVNRQIIFSWRNNQGYIVLAKEMISNHFSREAFEKLTYREIMIGDLVYDQYLRGFNLPTIDLQDFNLVQKLAEAIAYVDILLDYFQKNDVAAIVVSHTVYILGIPSRIAFLKKIPVYQVTTQNIFRIKPERMHGYTDYYDYPEIFSSLPPDIQQRGKYVALDRLKKRFEGQVAIDMPYSTKSAFINTEETELLNISARKFNVLIALHDFYDSPHVGFHFYPDFYAWLQKIGELSQNTDFHWYLKTHPDVYYDSQNLLNDFCQKNPNFFLVDRNISHHQLISHGIDVALTVYGTIASEYPALGIPVVNASPHNPHFRYNFSITPKNRFDYENLLLNLDNIQYKIEIDEIGEFYFMHHIYRMNSWIFMNYDLMLNEIGGYYRSISDDIFKYFLETNNKFSVENIRIAINNFILSDESSLSWQHFPEGLDKLRSRIGLNK